MDDSLQKSLQPPTDTSSKIKSTNSNSKRVQQESSEESKPTHKEWEQRRAIPLKLTSSSKATTRSPSADHARPKGLRERPVPTDRFRPDEYSCQTPTGSKPNTRKVQTSDVIIVEKIDAPEEWVMDWAITPPKIKGITKKMTTTESISTLPDMPSKIQSISEDNTVELDGKGVANNIVTSSQRSNETNEESREIPDASETNGLTFWDIVTPIQDIMTDYFRNEWVKKHGSVTSSTKIPEESEMQYDPSFQSEDIVFSGEHLTQSNDVVSQAVEMTMHTINTSVDEQSATPTSTSRDNTNEIITQSNIETATYPITNNQNELVMAITLPNDDVVSSTKEMTTKSDNEMTEVTTLTTLSRMNDSNEVVLPNKEMTMHTVNINAVDQMSTATFYSINASQVNMTSTIIETMSSPQTEEHNESVRVATTHHDQVVSPTEEMTTQSGGVRPTGILVSSCTDSSVGDFSKEVTTKELSSTSSTALQTETETSNSVPEIIRTNNSAKSKDKPAVVSIPVPDLSTQILNPGNYRTKRKVPSDKPTDRTDENPLKIKKGNERSAPETKDHDDEIVVRRSRSPPRRDDSRHRRDRSHSSIRSSNDSQYGRCSHGR